MRPCLTVRKMTLLLLCVQGCVTTRPVTPPPAVQSGFLGKSELMMPAPERSPYALNWLADPEQLDALKQGYTGIYVAPVNTAFLERGETSSSPEEIDSIAQYLRSAFINAIKRDAGGRFAVVNKPERETIVLELALIKLVPTTFEVNILASVGGIFIPGAPPVVGACNLAGSVAAHEIGKGRVAMALKVTDGATGALLGKAYDEREDRAALILNVQDFTRWGNARRSMQEWASEFAGLLVTPESQKISRPAPLGLLLW